LQRKFPHQRFEEKIEKVGKCWIWKGCQKDGIGYFTVGSRMEGSRRKESVLRFAFRFFNGPIGPGQVVFSRCTTASCVNPDHLRCGTRRDLVLQAIKRGRWIQGDASRFPNTAGENNGRSKLSNEQRKAIIIEKGKTKVIVMARRFNVTEQTIYHVQKNVLPD
jgi:hypothetical protein